MGTGLKIGAVIHIPFMQSIFDHGVITETILSTEVDIVHVGLIIIPRCPGSIGRYIAVPPWKSGFAGFNPA
jgi:hypothetical protein